MVQCLDRSEDSTELSRMIPTIHDDNDDDNAPNDIETYQDHQHDVFQYLLGHPTIG